MDFATENPLAKMVSISQFSRNWQTCMFSWAMIHWVPLTRDRLHGPHQLECFALDERVQSIAFIDGYTINPACRKCVIYSMTKLPKIGIFGKQLGQMVRKFFIRSRSAAANIFYSIKHLDAKTTVWDLHLFILTKLRPSRHPLVLNFPLFSSPKRCMSDIR